MRRAFVVTVAALLGAVVACVGGGGSLPGDGTGTDENGSSSSSSSGASSSSSSGNASSSSGASGQVGSDGSAATISIAGYNTACTIDSDCVAVYQGNVCDGCDCPNAAINQSDSTAYSHQLSTLIASCPQTGSECKCALPKVGCDPATKHCGVGVSSSDGG